MNGDNRLLWLWAQGVLGRGTRRAQNALDVFGSARALFEADAQTLRTSGVFTPAEVHAVLARDLDKYQRVLDDCERMNIALTVFDDPAYPPLLAAIYSPPLCLFSAGDRAHLTHALPIAMVGTRDPNYYGAEVAALCAGGLAAAGALVVSGFAMGIDALCHTAALDAGAPTVAVLGCGIDVDYPAPNRSLRARVEAHGCLVSEYPPGAPPLPPHFPVRNRVISGLSRGCVVVQGKAGSGSLITAGLALTQNRDVFAVCGPVNDPLMAGCHELVRQGAKPVFGIADVLGEYPGAGGAPAAVHAPEVPAKKAARALPDYLTQEQSDLLGLLRRSPQSVETLARQTDINAGRLLGMLTELEIYGLIEPRPGRMYQAL